MEKQITLALRDVSLLNSICSLWSQQAWIWGQTEFLGKSSHWIEMIPPHYLQVCDCFASQSVFCLFCPWLMCSNLSVFCWSTVLILIKLLGKESSNKNVKIERSQSVTFRGLTNRTTARTSMHRWELNITGNDNRIYIYKSNLDIRKQR